MKRYDYRNNYNTGLEFFKVSIDYYYYYKSIQNSKKELSNQSNHKKKECNVLQARVA